MKEASATATGQFEYSAGFHHRTLDAWIQEMHDLVYPEAGPFQRGDFRYDSLAMSIAYTFLFMEQHEHTERHMCMAFHQGWTDCFIYWNAFVPWLNCDVRYIATEPMETLGKYNVPFVELPTETKNRIIAAVKHLRTAVSIQGLGEAANKP